jgi:hypothetical protein
VSLVALSDGGKRENGRILVPGDPGYPMVIDRAFGAGHITETEFDELQALHRAVRDTS